MRFLILLLSFLAVATFGTYAQVPTISGDNLLCPNTTSWLYVAATYDSYQWETRPFGGSTFTPISGATNDSVLVDADDTPIYYRVTVTNSTGTFTSSELLIDGYAFLPPTVSSTGDYSSSGSGDFVLCPGDTMYFTLQLPYDTLITWTKDGNTIAGADSITLTVTEPGAYSVSGAPTNCPNYIEPLGLSLNVIECTSSSNQKLPDGTELRFFPVPTADELYLECEACTEPLRYELYSTEGRRLQEGQISESNFIDISQLASGLYWLRTEGGTVHQVLRR